MSSTLDVQAIRRALEEQHVFLRDQIARDETYLHAPVGSNPDPLDLAQAQITREQRAATLAQAQQQLAQIEIALQRLDDGTYGQCAECGERIEPGRLSVLPYASLCVRCQAKQEALP
jgi:RNA polymerase-binding transcription factor DksA